MDILEAIASRHSVRAFLDKPVSETIIRAVLEAARRAPSGANIQPWQVAVLQGSARVSLAEAILNERKTNPAPHADYQYYPTEWFEPYKARRVACGMALYNTLKIERDDQASRQAVWELNYYFFNAPVGLIFFLDNRLETGSFFDCGMFLQTIMLAARHYGLGTCPQASFIDYSAIIKDQLALPEHTTILCGMALGYPDEAAQINSYRTERETVDDFTKWYR